eukprot:8141111-Ditylum_brightwellii.AAC.1
MQTALMSTNRIRQMKHPFGYEIDLKKIAHVWERLIYGSGGELSRDKTYWWLIWWIWDRETAHIATKQELPLDLPLSIGKETSPSPLK